MTLPPVGARPRSRAPQARSCAGVRRALLLSGTLVGGILAVGTVGYHVIDDLGWLDAGHRGPVNEVRIDPGQILSSLCALSCGMILLRATGVPFTPIIHRLLHRYHLEDAGGEH
jgi:hypothetical protein